MRGYFGATGISLVVGKNDKGNDKNTCVIDEYKRPTLFLRVVDEVTKNDDFEEPGFHIQCWPPNVGLRDSTKIFVYLRRKEWDALTAGPDCDENHGFFISRCKYDRFNMLYYNMTVNP
ncbi:MAG: hypothetical protein AABX14_03540 [Candidatus Aenigmatarchaeota archaeon]